MLRIDMKKCIYCSHNFSDERPKSREHVIPEFLGGFLWEPFACKPCNSQLGSAVDAEWQQNHEVIKALHELEMPTDPNVFKIAQGAYSSKHGQRPSYELVGYAKTKVPFFVDRKRNVVNMSRDNLGDQVKAKKAIEGILKRDHSVPSDQAIKIAEEVIETLNKTRPGENQKVEKTIKGRKLTFSTQPHIVEGAVDMLDHFKPTIPVRSVVKIAYSFAAVLLQDDILSEEYETFRKFLSVPESGVKVRALALGTVWENLKPIHVLAARTKREKLYVVVILFHCMGFVIELGSAQYVTDAQCLFNIKEKTATMCHFAPDSEATINKILDEEFLGSQ